ncbi:hypothetical protein SAMN05443572_106143 [Myxococcus fulvus]|uniref:Uncharacterized protein n=1 Tax=Myxococcus fulvus TaxID=33 RepID=A0ABY1CLR4_MYXFU|nr:hypothetical protein SAMN05443572_106143 [Myxococcus fulvus]
MFGTDLARLRARMSTEHTARMPGRPGRGAPTHTARADGRPGADDEPRSQPLLVTDVTGQGMVLRKHQGQYDGSAFTRDVYPPGPEPACLEESLRPSPPFPGEEDQRQGEAILGRRLTLDGSEDGFEFIVPQAGLARFEDGTGYHAQPSVRQALPEIGNEVVWRMIQSHQRRHSPILNLRGSRRRANAPPDVDLEEPGVTRERPVIREALLRAEVGERFGGRLPGTPQESDDGPRSRGDSQQLSQSLCSWRWPASGE